ncbi:MAG: hypothetical protein WDW38_009189 [Sanguina aurantia]
MVGDVQGPDVPSGGGRPTASGDAQPLTDASPKAASVQVQACAVAFAHGDAARAAPHVASPRASWRVESIVGGMTSNDVNGVSSSPRHPSPGCAATAGASAMSAPCPCGGWEVPPHRPLMAAGVNSGATRLHAMPPPTCVTCGGGCLRPHVAAAGVTATQLDCVKGMRGTHTRPARLKGGVGALRRPQ